MEVVINGPPCTSIYDDCTDIEPIVWRSSEQDRRYTTGCRAEFRTWWSRSKPRIKSQGREAVTTTSWKHIEMLPASHGSVRGPESREARVLSPEFMIQSRETEDLGKWSSNLVHTCTLQNVAREDMVAET